MTPPNSNQVLQISWGQLVTIIISFVAALMLQWVAITNRLTALESSNGSRDREISEIKSNEVHSKREVINKLDKIQTDVNSIRVELERKQNRP